MTSKVISLLNQQIESGTSEVNGKAVESRLSVDSSSSIQNRVRVLLNHFSQFNRWQMLWVRFTKKFRQNMAELEALLQYSTSHAVWDIAYLNRKQAAEKLNPAENKELSYLILFHDSPFVHRITQLKLKAEFERLSSQEHQELTALQRNPYPNAQVPNQLLELLWPASGNRGLDLLDLN